MNNIGKQLESISHKINSLIVSPLFAELPVSELETINKTVSDADSFMISINGLCNLLDRINKKELDKYNGIGNSRGSRECLINLLKKLLPSNHIRIDENVYKPIGMILLLRGYFVHKRNSNIKIAENYFDVKFPIEDYNNLWTKILYQFRTVLDNIIELLDEKANSSSRLQDNINEDISVFLRLNYIKRYGHLLEKSSIKKILLYLYMEKDMSDCEIAKEFRYDIIELRELLLPIVPSLVYPKYLDSKTTLITLTDFGRSIIENLFFDK